MAAAHLRGPTIVSHRAGQFSCRGKHGYVDAALAFRIAKRMGGELNHYRCVFCGLWHIGNNDPHKSNRAHELIRTEAPDA